MKNDEPRKDKEKVHSKITKLKHPGASKWTGKSFGRDLRMVRDNGEAGDGPAGLEAFDHGGRRSNSSRPAEF
mgnify:CR=1 FL=1